jgi:hypothetical protein
MNAYLASRMVDERQADERVAGGGPVRRTAPRAHVDPAAWLPRAVAHADPTDLAGAAAAGAGGAGVPRTGPARRVRRIAGWLLIEAGLRLAVGRRPAALRG